MKTSSMMSIPSAVSPSTGPSASANCSPSPTVSWQRLNSLIENGLSGILALERDNADRLYLYDTVGYWVSFERSAWQSCRLFPKHSVSLLTLKPYAFPIVMSSVPDSEVQSYLRRHIVRSCGSRAVLPVSDFRPEQYSRWHRGIVDDLQ